MIVIHCATSPKQAVKQPYGLASFVESRDRCETLFARSFKFFCLVFDRISSFKNARSSFGHRQNRHRLSDVVLQQMSDEDRARTKETPAV